MVGPAGEVAAARAAGVPPGFKLKASNGFSITAFGIEARKSKPAFVGVLARKRGEEAFYVARGTVTASSFQADFGDIGEIAVTFVSTGKVKTAHSHCNPQPFTFDAGYYEGKIAFHGELGYTDVQASKAPGDISFFLNIVCLGMSGGSGSFPLPGAELDVGSPRPGGATHLTIIKNRPTARTHFEADFSEVHDGIGIERSAIGFAPPGAFRFDSSIRAARLHLPAPFSGTGRFHRRARPGNRWTGDLTVDLPGKQDMALTGGRLQASMAYAHWSWHPDPDLRRFLTIQPPWR